MGVNQGSRELLLVDRGDVEDIGKNQTVGGVGLVKRINVVRVSRDEEY
jgi:hypothetical protein